ncbi:glycoside hydrolase family 19 protein [Deinococcus pimensis]|uniref:glycoside hydrolase family 19 protein n=1 Tax=Deinococcus pimensis TaxID=309888 RepID=UPI0004B26587|nr:hypothetical protein [Deinococcus pimensis]
MITPELLRAIRPDADPADITTAAPALALAAREAGIVSRAQIAAWLANIAHESAFSLARENLYYTTSARLCEVWPSRFPRPHDPTRYCRDPRALANLVYAGRLGNGSEASGDGWRYRGGGYLQLTGRDHYRAHTLEGADLARDPQLIERPDVAARVAAAFWVRTGCNDCAEDVERTRELVNGPTKLGLSEVRAYHRAALRALPQGSAARVLTRAGRWQDVRGERVEVELASGVTVVVNATDPDVVQIRLK